MKTLFKIILILSILFFSCKKDKDLPKPDNTVQNNNTGTTQPVVNVNIVDSMYFGTWEIDSKGSFQNIDSLYQFDYYLSCSVEAPDNAPQQLTFLNDTMFFLNVPGEWLYNNGDDTLRFGTNGFISNQFYTKCN